jgi:DNA-3-methyladenine glycosylase
VLIRAAQPLAGIELMRLRRGRPADPDDRLASGPARLCQALGVDRSLDGHDLTLGRRLWLTPGASEGEAGPRDEEVAGGPRVGVAYAGEWATRPWRFVLRGHPSLSRP